MEPAVAERVSRLPIGLRVIEEQGAAFDRHEDGSYSIHHGDQGHCGFLQPRNLCGIHGELGAPSKPTVCQQHPFHLLQTPDGVHVGLSFQCTSVRDGSGRDVSAHEEWLRGLLERGSCLTVIDPERIALTESSTLTWSEYGVLERWFQSQVELVGFDSAVASALEVVARGEGVSGGATSDLASQDPGGPGRLAAAGDSRGAGAEVGASQGQPGGFRVLRGGAVNALLDSMRYGLLKLHLPGPDPERTGRLDNAYLNGEALDLPEFGWHDTWDALDLKTSTAFPAEWEPWIQRWAAMQVHRKALVVKRPILFNLWGFGLVPRMIRLLTVLHASRAGRQEPVREDYLEALDWCECHLGANGDLMDYLGPAFTAALESILA